MGWYSHLFQNFPQFVVIHIVKGFGIVNKAERDVFLEFSWFFSDPEELETAVMIYAEYIMRNAGLDEAPAGINVAGRNINNLRNADDTTLWQKVKRN